MWECILALILIYIQSTWSLNKTSYDGAETWRTFLNNADDVNFFKQFLFNGFQNLSTEIWFLDEQEVEYMVIRSEIEQMKALLSARNLTFEVFIKDIKKLIDEEKVTREFSGPLRSDPKMMFETFPTLSVIEQYLNKLHQDFPTICKVHNIGHSVENRNIKMIKISNGFTKNKSVILLAGLHSREWASITSALYIADKLIREFDQLPIKMRNINWYIIPVANPDGYEYTHNHARLWRKNRRVGPQNCEGVDLNRNFARDWGVVYDADSKICADAYAGEGPFSEPETRAIRDAIKGLNKTVAAIVDFHAYGRLILYPWGAKPDRIKHANYSERIAKGMHDILDKTYGVHYRYGNVYHLIYPASGSLIDWTYSIGVKISFAIEIGNPSTRFLLPPNDIVKTGEKMWVAVKFLVSNIKD